MSQFITRPYNWPPYYIQYQNNLAILDYPPYQTDYPESSQRTILSSSPDNIDIHPIYHNRRSLSSDYHNQWDTHPLSLDSDKFQYPDLDMHAEDTAQPIHPDDGSEDKSSHSSSPLPASLPLSHPSVKVEPDDPDGCFIMELSSMSPSLPLSVSGINQSLAPPTEVPLRATQASKEMRKMMGVFRLNPFAMHSGEGRGVMPALWCGGGPLEEEPLIFEFQLDIEDDSGDSLVGIPGSGSPIATDLLAVAEEEEQLRSFSPSFELHPEDLRSEMGGDEDREREQEDYTDPDQQNEWSDADGGNQSEVDTSSPSQNSVHTPSETRSASAPFNNESSSYQYPIVNNPAVASSWDIESYQTHGEEHLPPVEKMEGVHKMHRVHTTSHPYLRRSIANPHQASPSSSTQSLSQSYPHLPHTTTTTTSSQTQPQQLNYVYPILQQHPTTQHHYVSDNNQVPSQNHSQNYSQQQHPTTTTTVHDSMISSAPPLELISHRPENSIYSSSSSYMRSVGKLPATEDETSSALQHHHQHHHHPAGIVNEYNPRGTVSNNNIYASQHDTGGGQHHQHHHQYDTEQHNLSSSTSSTAGGHPSHVLSPSRRWSLPETIGGGGGPSFRSSGSTM